MLYICAVCSYWSYHRIILGSIKLGRTGSVSHASIPSKFETKLYGGANENDAFHSRVPRFKPSNTDLPGPGAYAVPGSGATTLIKNGTVDGGLTSLSKKGYGNGFASKSDRFKDDPMATFFQPGPGKYNCGAQMTSKTSHQREAVPFNSTDGRGMETTEPGSIIHAVPGPGHYVIPSCLNPKPKRKSRRTRVGLEFNNDGVGGQGVAASISAHAASIAKDIVDAGYITRKGLMPTPGYMMRAKVQATLQDEAEDAKKYMRKLKKKQMLSLTEAGGASAQPIGNLDEREVHKKVLYGALPVYVDDYSEQPFLSTSERFPLDKKKAMLPAPGQYDVSAATAGPGKVVVSSPFTSSTLRIKGASNSFDDSPGPGAYDVSTGGEPSFMSHNVSRAFAKIGIDRFGIPLEKRVIRPAVPGPGTYDKQPSIQIKKQPPRDDMLSPRGGGGVLSSRTAPLQVYGTDSGITAMSSLLLGGNVSMAERERRKAMAVSFKDPALAPGPGSYAPDAVEKVKNSKSFHLNIRRDWVN